MSAPLPPEVLLEVLDHISGPPLAFPDPESVETLLALCLTSRSFYPHAAQALYTALSITSFSALGKLSESGVPAGRRVRALFFSRRARLMAGAHPPAERLLSLLAPTLQRVVFEGHTPSPLDAYLSRMALLQEVAFTRQATELWGLAPVYLEPCPGVKRLALHDYWTDEYHVTRICALFPGVVELVLACDVGAELVREVLKTCTHIRKVTILRPRARPGDDWHAPLQTNFDPEVEKKKALGVESRERGTHIWELSAPEEDGEQPPSWAPGCVRAGDCWDLGGVEW
ncbi:hypothetical protein CALCODRAFT_480430 [Calocera cornea HHB12733]|uniref:F-box domain-containing protein n=1 Tax=Calocera cornea HHB12733 TaxID=1353952 RepID=A0A165IME4_9BASI|nr:hypothetical protein CALCODRAFT_480430 [Calocera cornea HHB12733]